MPAPPSSAQQAANRAAAAAAAAGRASPGAAAGTGTRNGGSVGPSASSGRAGGSASPGGSQNQGGAARSASPGASAGTGSRSNAGVGGPGGNSARNDRAGAFNGGLGTGARGGMLSGGVGSVRDDRAGPFNGGLGTAATRSPMMGRGLMNSLAGMNRQDRQLVDVGSRLGKQYGLGLGGGIVGASEISKTLEGELGSRWSNEMNRAAIAQNILNRLDLAATRGRYGKSLMGVLKGYDATGYDQKRLAGKISPKGISAFQNTKFGTPTYGAALTSLDKQMAGTGPALPDFVMNATNYHNPKTSSPSWGRNAKSFGPHAFSNPDRGFGQSAVAAARDRAAGTALAMGNIPGMGGMPTGQGVTQVAGAMPSLAGSRRVAEFAARGKPETPNQRVAQFAARGKPSVPGADMARAQPVPQPNEVIGQGPTLADVMPAARVASYDPLGSIRAPQRQQMAKMQDRIAPEVTMAKTQDRIAPETSTPPMGGALNPRVASLMSDFGVRHLNTGLPDQYADTNPDRSYANIPASGFPRTEAAAADPAQFANSPLGRTLASIGRGVGQGFGAINKGMKAYEANKGKLAFANAIGINPIGDAVKSAASQGISNMQAGLGPYASGGTQVAGVGGSVAPDMPGSPPASTQRSTLIALLDRIMSNGGPRTPRETTMVKKIAQAIQSMPAYDYSLTEAPV